MLENKLRLALNIRLIIGFEANGGLNIWGKLKKTSNVVLLKYILKFIYC